MNNFIVDLLDSAAINFVGEDVETFTYLGSVIHNSAECDAQVHRGLGLASGGMDSLKKTVWN